MKRFLLSLVVTAVVGTSVLADDIRFADTVAVRQPPRARQGAPRGRAVRPARNVAPGARRARPVPNARPVRPRAANFRPRLAANPGRRVPNWGPAGRNFRAQGPLGWHVRRPNGTIIARNYPNWSRNWWSPRWGVWFRYDPATTGYYYFEPAVGYYVQTERIVTYRQPLETPAPEPTTDPDAIPLVDPPSPIEP